LYADFLIKLLKDCNDVVCSSLQVTVDFRKLLKYVVAMLFFPCYTPPFDIYVNIVKKLSVLHYVPPLAITLNSIVKHLSIVRYMPSLTIKLVRYCNEFVYP